MNHIAVCGDMVHSTPFLLGSFRVMKPTSFFVSLVSIILSLVIIKGICFSNEDYSGAKRVKKEEIIEKEVRNALQKSEETVVIILLKEPEGLRKETMVIIRKNIREIQDEFLSHLTEDDLKLTRRNKNTPILIGKLTRAGLKKIETLTDKIRSVSISRRVKAF